MKRLLIASCLLAAAGAAFGQFRAIPKEAERGEIRHLHDMMVSINGEERRLAPGAQIRDAANRLVLPVALPPDSLVKYLADGQGVVSRVWILTPEEAAQRDERRR